MAVKYCTIDYERELTLVVETRVGDERLLIGLGQLITDQNHETVEYALSVSDPWQGKRVGDLLLDCCLVLAARWGIAGVLAETDPENMRMLSRFHKRGFNSVIRREDEEVFLRKGLL